MAEAVRKKNKHLLLSVQERMMSKKLKEAKGQSGNHLERGQQQNAFIPYIPKDCILNILARLPTESLPKSMLVCKPWFHIICSPKFIDSHLIRSESVLLFQRSVSDEEQSNPPPGQAPLVLFGRPKQTVKKSTRLSINFIEFTEGESRQAEYRLRCSGKIRAACNGLLLIDNVTKKGGLIVLNPVTSKGTSLPVGTIIPSQNSESYGFAYSDATGEYKAVHLFCDDLGYINCEVLILGEKLWKEVNGPTFGFFNGAWLGYRPVSAIGALHWIPHAHHGDYLVSMELTTDKFYSVPLPTMCGKYDRVLEMGRILAFITHEGQNIDVWILKGLHDEVWTKHHCLSVGCIRDMVPILSLKNKWDVIFWRKVDGSLHVYDLKLELMRKVEGQVPADSFPHVNSLVSWGKAQDVCDDW